MYRGGAAVVKRIKEREDLIETVSLRLSERVLRNESGEMNNFTKVAEKLKERRNRGKEAGRAMRRRDWPEIVAAETENYDYL